MSELIHLAGMAIKTTFEPLNFTTVRDFDWSAVDDDTYDGAEDAGCPIGRGPTEAAAIADLIIETGRFHDAAEREAAWRYRLAVLERGELDQPTDAERRWRGYLEALAAEPFQPTASGIRRLLITTGTNQPGYIGKEP